MKKYVKFIAKPNTWYKEGSEVLIQAFSKIENKVYGYRMTLDDYNEKLSNNDTSEVFWGIRACEDNPNENNMGYKAGDERMDGEWCYFDEFEILEIEE